MRPCVVVGTRPEIIKAAPLVEALRSRGECLFLHSGQHYDREMSGVFLEQLRLPAPSKYLDVGSGSRAQQTLAVCSRVAAAVKPARCDAVFAVGDTNTVLGALLGAVKAHVPAVHVEAGLRSYDPRMVEEDNRRTADHLSTLLFAPTRFNEETLRAERVRGTIRVVGNTAIDAVSRHLPLAEKASTVLDRVPPGEFVLATFHRAENVDDPAVLASFVKVVTECPLPVVFPVHPRTRERLKATGLMALLESSPRVTLLPPADYFDALVLLRGCAFALTDSGGLQEEATAPPMRKKVFVMRVSTERQEAVEAGFVEVVGTDGDAVLSRLRGFDRARWSPAEASPYGDGRTGERIAIIATKLLD